MKFSLLLFCLSMVATAQDHNVGTQGAAALVTPQPRFNLSPEQRSCADAFKQRLAKRVVRLKRPAYVYHWFNSWAYNGKPAIANEAPDYQDQIVSVAKSKAAKFWRQGLGPENEVWNAKNFSMGEGLYAATDPLITSSYGNASSGQLIRIRLNADTPFLALVGRDFSLELPSPPCKDRSTDLVHPADLDAYRTAVSELGVSGLIYPYDFQKYDSLTSEHGNAFVLFDDKLLAASNLVGFPREQVTSSTAPRSTDLPETLYWKFSRGLLAKFGIKASEFNNPTEQARLESWAHENIISTNPISDFVDLPPDPARKSP